MTRHPRLWLAILALGLAGCARDPLVLGLESEEAIDQILADVEQGLPGIEQAVAQGRAAKDAGNEAANETIIDPAYTQAVEWREKLAPLAYSNRGSEPRVSGLWERVTRAERELLAVALAPPRSGAIRYPPGIGQYWFRYRVLTPVHGWALALALIGTAVVFFLLLGGLQRLGSGARRRLTVVCTFIAGLFYLVAFFWPQASNPLKAYETPLGNFNLVMGGFAVGLGVINLCSVHGKVLLRRGPGSLNSLAFFVGFIGMVVFGLWQMYVPVEDNAPALPLVTAAYKVLFDGLLQPLLATTFSLLGFFIVSAAYRAFRIRNTEAALMTVVAFLVMLGSVPFGQILTAWIPVDSAFGWLRLERLTNWLLTTPNAAAFRGILFGATVGSLALSLRVWLSLERGSYFGKEF